MSFTNSSNRDKIATAAKRAAAERYFAYAKERLDELTAGARAFHESQRHPPAPVEGVAAEQEAALSLVSLSHGTSGSAESVQTELASLRSLQESVGSRIQLLQGSRAEEA